MIIQLTWHGEPIGKLEAQFVWPPPLDRGALLPLLSAASGSAAVSVVFQLSGALEALELDLARPFVVRGPLGGPSEVGAFQGNVEARFDEIDVHGFVAAPLASRGGKGSSVSIQRQAGESGFSLSGGALSGHVEIASQDGVFTFAAAVEGARSELRAYLGGGGVLELRSAAGSAPVVSLNWRWPRSFDAESPWAVALQALLAFITERPSTTLSLGFELAPDAAFWERASRVGSVVPPEPPAPTEVVAPIDRAPPKAAVRTMGASRWLLLGGIAAALVAFIAVAVLWNPSGIRSGSAVLLPPGTVSTGALQPAPAHSGAAGDAGKKR
jgi:hypothetical protein